MLKIVCFAAVFLFKISRAPRFLDRFPLSLELCPILVGRRKWNIFPTLRPTRPASLGGSPRHIWYVSFELFPRFLPSCALLFRRQTKSGASLTSSPRNSAWLGFTGHVFFLLLSTLSSLFWLLLLDRSTISRPSEPGILPIPGFVQPVLAHPSGLIFVLFILPRPSDFHAGFASPVTPAVLPSAPASAGEGRLLNSNHLFDPSIFSDLTRRFICVSCDAGGSSFCASFCWRRPPFQFQPSLWSIHLLWFDRSVLAALFPFYAAWYASRHTSCWWRPLLLRIPTTCNYVHSFGNLNVHECLQVYWSFSASM